MRRAWGAIKVFATRIRWVLIAKIIFSLVVIVSAATIAVTPSNYQAEIGSSITFATGLPATDKGFSFTTSGSSASLTGTTCTTPAVFSPSPGIANNAIAAGHVVYDVQINQTSSAMAGVMFNVTLVLGSTVFLPLCIQTLATPINGQIIDCKYDVGPSLPSSPFTFKVVVQ